MTNYDLTVYNYLKTLVSPCKLTVSNDETTIRCPFCGDSKKSKYSMHMYIQNKPPFKYYCQRCNASGIANSKLIGLLNGNDAGIINYLGNTYNTYISNLNKKYGRSINRIQDKDYSYEVPNIDSEIPSKNIKYIEDRLGIKLDTDDISRYKIVLDMVEFYNVNNIKSEESEYRSLNKLNQEYFKYMLSDNTIMNCRDMTGKNKRKHIKQRLYKGYEGSSTRMYSISNNVNLENEVFNIHIAEGFFDIISIYNHIHNTKMEDNDLFVSCNSKGYKYVLDHLFSEGITNMNINIYSDKDVKPKDFTGNYMLGNCIPALINDADIYYNNNPNEKDFGVRGTEIDLSTPIKFSSLI